MLSMIEDVQDAVQQAVTRQCVLFVVYAADDSIGASFIDDSVNTAEDLMARHVVLRIYPDTVAESSFFQIFPRHNAPALFAIRGARVLGVFSADDGDSSFRAQIEQLLEAELEAEPTPSPAPEAERESVPSPGPSSSSPSSSTNPAPSSARATNDFIKERQRNEQARQRVLRLLQEDRLEQQAREKRERQIHESLKREKPEQEPSSSFHRPASAVAIVVRLFDGTTIKSTFRRDQTLGDVRTWIEQQLDISYPPFSLHCTHLRRMLSDVDELKTLQELDLYPSATITLRPVPTYTTVQNQWSIGDSLSRGVSSVTNALSIFLGINYTPQQASPAPVSSSGSNAGPATSSSGTATPVPAVDELQMPDVASRTGSSNKIQTLEDHDPNKEDRKTYNGNQLSVEDNKGDNED
ncbi:hypothetical protein CANCADRAFT_68408 [Tortispora caseinolytica NRRL Y-17796]|uniref:UBX domain-containing protein n=1 Tax=Tortispora caseinolytica NRRL Y-17796 TaxID=767744 RepID=A0A1E4TF84_9ASCO|nr:hypothetical protein CANCADRAFT_68408 [Tortispora caseinolytica NRRL Y-17796]